MPKKQNYVGRPPVGGRSNQADFRPLTMNERLERFPPIACRILARVRKPEGGVRVLTDMEISAVSKLSLAEVARLSRLTSWEGVSITTINAFTKGCGADLDNRDWQRHNAVYMNKISGLPRYLTQSPEWESKFKPLLQRWVQAEAA